VNEDLSRTDGVIQCTEISTEQMLALGWRIARAILIVTRGIPVP
jgi:hypothetical protein